MKRITTAVAALLLGIIVAPASHALTTVQGGPLTGLAPDSPTQVHLALSGYPTNHGLYIEEAVQPAAGTRPTITGNPIWVSPVAADLAQGAKSISGDVVLTVDNGHSWGADCVHQQCGIFIQLDHTAATDTSEDQFIPLTFNGASITTTTTSNLPADTLTVEINGKPATANAPLTAHYRTPLFFKVVTGSGVKATLQSFTPQLCPVLHNRVEILKGSGACDIAVTSAGDHAHSTVTAHFPLLLSPAEQRIATKHFALKVTKSRKLQKITRFGETISYASSSNSCVISGNTVIAVLPGLCTITATAPGSANYSALSQTFTIKVRK
jgi:hypothetical protein